MNRNLPFLRFLLPVKGFTLIELLVVVAIIAILAIVGFALLTSTQSKARDSKRVQDIISMSKAMEVNYKIGIGYVVPLGDTWFADFKKPVNPKPGGADYFTNSPTAGLYAFCAYLENSTGNANTTTGSDIGAAGGSFFCKRNQQ